MGNIVTLQGDGGAVLIEPAINDLGWTRCHLLTNEKVFLGADVLEAVVAGLLRAVSDERPASKAGCLEGWKVTCALLLSEAHHALYYADDGPQRLLFWQNAYNDPMTLAGKITLSPEQRQQWRAQLEAMLDTKPQNGARQATITKEITEIGGAEALK